MTFHLKDWPRSYSVVSKLTTPLRIKKALDRALLDAGIPFLTGSYPAEVVVSSEGTFAGITMANRNGRQLVRAKVLIDATDSACLARQTGFAFEPFKPGRFSFGFRVMGGPRAEGQNLVARTLEETFVDKNKRELAIHDYTVSLDVEEDSWRELCLVEQTVRELCIGKGAIEHSERPTYNLRTRLARASVATDWPRAEQIDLVHFRRR